MAGVADDGQVRDAVAVEVAHDRPLRIRLAAARVGQVFLEGAVPQAQQNGNVMGAAVAGGEVELSVAVEVGRNQAQGLKSSPVADLVLEGAAALAEQDRN